MRCASCGVADSTAGAGWTESPTSSGSCAKQARRRGDLGGTLDQVRAALDHALTTERETLAAASDDDARIAEMDLATLPDDLAAAIRELASYNWRSDEARATYESIHDMLRREVLDAQFAGMKQALESPDPAMMQQVKDMLADLNALLAAHARQEDTTDQFADFMARHGGFFPEQPESVEELIDALARRQAAAQRMLSSLGAEQRQQLGQLISQALGDADLASLMAQLADNLRALRPGMDRSSPARDAAGSRWATVLRSRRWPSCRSWSRWRLSCPTATSAAASTMSTSRCWNAGWARTLRETSRRSAISNGNWNVRAF